MNLVSLDPMALENFKLVKKEGPVTLDFFTEFCHIYGFLNATIVKFQGFDQNLLDIELKFADMSVNGSYKAKAKLLGMSLNGNGVFFSNYSK